MQWNLVRRKFPWLKTVRWRFLCRNFRLRIFQRCNFPRRNYLRWNLPRRILSRWKCHQAKFLVLKFVVYANRYCENIIISTIPRVQMHYFKYLKSRRKFNNFRKQSAIAPFFQIFFIFKKKLLISWDPTPFNGKKWKNS